MVTSSFLQRARVVDDETDVGGREVRAERGHAVAPVGDDLDLVVDIGERGADLAVGELGTGPAATVAAVTRRAVGREQGAPGGRRRTRPPDSGSFVNSRTTNTAVPMTTRTSTAFTMRLNIRRGEVRVAAT